MNKKTTHATVALFINQEEEKKPLINSVMAFIKSTNKVEIPRKKIEDIQTALSEAINNAVTFAYPNKQGKVSVFISIYENKVLQFKIRDYGCGIKDLKKAREPLYTTANSQEHSGLGFSIMESFSDRVTIKSTVGKGTTVNLKFQL